MDNFNRDPRLGTLTPPPPPPPPPEPTGDCPCPCPCPIEPPDEPYDVEVIPDTEVLLHGCPGNTYAIVTRGYVSDVLSAHNEDHEAHSKRFEEIEEEIASISGGMFPELTADIKELKVETATLFATTDDLKEADVAIGRRIDNIDTEIAEIDTEIAGKQDAIFFTSDFVTGGNSISLNYGGVTKDSELPVKGKDIFSAIPTITIKDIEEGGANV